MLTDIQYCETVSYKKRKALRNYTGRGNWSDGWREVFTSGGYQKRELGENVLELNGLSGHGFSNVNLTVKKGSIVGLTGLQGSGSSELLQGLFGAVTVTGGTLKVSGKECRIHSIQGAMKAGIAMLASNRKENSVIPDMSILENMYLYRTGSVCPTTTNLCQKRKRAL